MKYFFHRIGFYGIVFLSAIQGIAQKEVATLTPSYAVEAYRNKSSYAISNEATGEVLVFFKTKNRFSFHLLDSTLTVKREMTSPLVRYKYKNVLGTCVRGQEYLVFLTNRNSEKILVLTVNPNRGVVNFKELDFKFKKEVFFKSISFKDQLYLFTIQKRSSECNVYTFDNSLGIQKQIVSFKGLENKKETDTSYTRSLYQIWGESYTSSVPTIVDKQSVDMTATAEEIKAYIIDDKFVFTFDHLSDRTVVYTLDPKTYAIEENSYPLGDLKYIYDRYYLKHNSYVHQGKIYQMISSDEEMKFSVTDIRTNTVVKKITLKNTDSITFKNTPIIKRSGLGKKSLSNTPRIREYEETYKLLKRIMKSKVGITVHEVSDGYKVRLGGLQYAPSGGGAGMMMPGMGMPIGMGLTFAVGFNPSSKSSATDLTSTIHIDCLFDKDFNHIEGEVTKTPFEKIKELDTKKARFKLKNIFKHKDKMYLGHYHPKSKTYKILEFD